MADTIRELIDALTEIAAELPQGLDSEIRIGVCDHSNLQMFENDVDVTLHTEIDTKTREVRRTYGLIRLHHHPGESPGPVYRGVAADADEELRRLVEGEDG